MINSEITKAVVKVGAGRGFIVQAKHSRLVITAAHCLPRFPPCHGASCIDERTYAKLLGPLGSRKPKVSAECLFADPIADIAVLGSPDGQVLWEQAEAYKALTADVPALCISKAPRSGRGWLLSLANEWQSCLVKHIGDKLSFASPSPLWIENAAGGIRGGMSGSPILTDDSKAIGVVCTAGGIGNKPHTAGGPNPYLAHHLPGWLLPQ